MAFPLVPQMPQQNIVPGGQTLGLGNRFRNWSANNKNALLALGAGLIGNRENATLNPISAAMSGMAQGSQFDQQARQEAERQNATVQWLVQNKGMQPEQAEAVVRGDPAILSSMLRGEDTPTSFQEWQLAQENPGYAEALERDRMAQSKYSLNPIYMTDEQGGTHIGQLGTDGTMRVVDTPDGMDLAPGYEKVDGGTQWLIIDKRSGQVIQSYPKDIAGEQSAQEFGKAAGTSAAALPSVLQSGDRIIGAIDSLLQDEAFPRIVGPVQGVAPGLTNWSGGANRAQSYLDQILGGTFLQAYNDLRGAGAITEREGAAAKDAYNRLQNTRMDDASYKEALMQFRAEMVRLMEIARLRASQSSQQFPTESLTPPPPPSGGLEDPLGIR